MYIFYKMFFLGQKNWPEAYHPTCASSIIQFSLALSPLSPLHYSTCVSSTSLDCDSSRWLKNRSYVAVENVDNLTNLNIFQPLAAANYIQELLMYGSGWMWSKVYFVQGKWGPRHVDCGQPASFSSNIKRIVKLGVQYPLPEWIFRFTQFTWSSCYYTSSHTVCQFVTATFDIRAFLVLNDPHERAVPMSILMVKFFCAANWKKKRFYILISISS